MPWVRDLLFHDLLDQQTEKKKQGLKGANTGQSFKPRCTLFPFQNKSHASIPWFKALFQLKEEIKELEYILIKQQHKNW